MAAELLKSRNHPSLIMWGTSGNMFAHNQDQNPRLIGMKGWADKDRNWLHRVKPQVGFDCIALIKRYDPTRPAFTHNGDYIGDVYTTNCYLNFLPLQEREEWLSAWMRHGEQPFWAIEFGTPLNCSYMRGRRYGGWGRHDLGAAITSEPLLSEFCAIYLGKHAYELETDEYRRKISSQLKSGQMYKSWHHLPVLDFAPANLLIQKLFIANTWRSWRTFGCSIMPIAWENGYCWQKKQIANNRVRMKPFVPGTRGIYYEFVDRGTYDYLEPEVWKFHPAAQSMFNANRDTLAWICGRQENGDLVSFTSKDHNFWSGTTIEKSIALLNQFRKKSNYDIRWKVTIAGKKYCENYEKGVLGAGGKQFLPIKFSAPTTGPKPVKGCISLEASIGSDKHEDTFEFKVFAKPGTIDADVMVYDPSGKTQVALKALGCRVSNWRPGIEMKTPLIIGEIRSKTSWPLPGLRDFVLKGGRLLIICRNQEWLKNCLGFRLAEHLPRRAFRSIKDHPVLASLKDEDIRDWTGKNLFPEPFPSYPAVHELSVYGWHWGNRGAIASTVMEKPHYSAWTPLLECEFDLAYSPLMELRTGKGCVVLSTLYFDDKVKSEPAAAIILARLIEYLNSDKSSGKTCATAYVGGDKWEKRLKSIGLIFQRTTLSELDKFGLVIADPSAENADALVRYTKAGGNVLFLPGQDNEVIPGAKIMLKQKFHGSLTPPDWPCAWGLSASDLRWRADHPAWLLHGDIEIGSDGLLGRRKLGKGKMIYCQINPWLFDTKKNSFMRYTVWRQSRALSQILANLGAGFVADERLFMPCKKDKFNPISLAGIWNAVQTVPLPSKPKPYQDQKISRKALALCQEQSLRISGHWEGIRLPALFESKGGKWRNSDGEAVLTRIINIPKSWVGNNLVLSLGKIDDNDETYFNGRKIGATQGYDIKRKYIVPSDLVKSGFNRLTVRVFDKYGGGGFTDFSRELSIVPEADTDEKAVKSPYHPDYIKEFIIGDNPYRYKRW